MAESRRRAIPERMAKQDPVAVDSYDEELADGYKWQQKQQRASKSSKLRIQLTLALLVFGAVVIIILWKL